MSINGALRTSVSGMNAQGNRLSAVSDNIANQSTTGYKKADVEFSTLVLDGGGTDYSSGSVMSQTRRNISAQGAIVGTSSATDIAIQGNGFFVVQDPNGGQAYTRAGAFVQRYDANAQATYLVNSAGYRLTGQPVGGGAVETINLPVGKIMEPKATDTISLENLQLPVSQPKPAAAPAAFDPANPTSDYKTSVTVFDAVGTPTVVDVYATKMDDNQWRLDFATTAADGTTTQLGGTTTVTFDSDTGKVDTPNPLGPITLDALPGRTEQIDVKFGNVTEYDAKYLADAQRNGNPASPVTDFRVGSDGTISAILESGDTVDIYRAQMAKFKSADQLETMTGNVFRPTKSSGEPQFGFAGENGFGTTQSGALEQSNVDLATELTFMIESQRGYSANSKSFQTGAEMLDVLINLKR
ncbi:MAG: flagellar hook protein FlgE [Fulvimarina manganoxydans]|uniref:flagellar hook protein FlgE n=1 Tax=Fulvimarina manganoxydans TaxID=937218 RepID=UPI002353E3BA|nr:flagellar hook protein FlgE [Fulvimarina manganoxydans]MCK5934099.1 flagellar hook protein FlgE [Fulvimarina manganoxydans]